MSDDAAGPSSKKPRIEKRKKPVDTSEESEENEDQEMETEETTPTPEVKQTPDPGTAPRAIYVETGVKKTRDSSKAISQSTAAYGVARMVSCDHLFALDIIMDRFDDAFRFIGATLQDALNARQSAQANPLSLDNFVLVAKWFVLMRVYSITDKLLYTNARTIGHVGINKTKKMPLPLSKVVNGIGIVRAGSGKAKIIPMIEDMLDSTNFTTKVTSEVLDDWELFTDLLVENGITKLDVLTSDENGNQWWIIDTRDIAHKEEEATFAADNVVLCSPFAEPSQYDAMLAAWMRRGNVTFFRMRKQKKLQTGYRRWRTITESYSDEMFDLNYSFRAWILKGKDM